MKEELKQEEVEILSSGEWAERELPLDFFNRNMEEIFSEIYEKYSATVYRIGYRILRDHALAEDARQDTFMNVYRGLRFFRGESKLSTWITRITVNVCLGILRKNKRHSVVELDSNPDTYNQIVALDDSNPYRTCTASESKMRVQRALNDISNKHEIVVRLHDLEGHTIPEIARQLHVPSGTVKSRLFYGRQELKDRLNTTPSAIYAN